MLVESARVSCLGPPRPFLSLSWNRKSYRSVIGCYQDAALLLAQFEGWIVEDGHVAIPTDAEFEYPGRVRVSNYAIGVDHCDSIGVTKTEKSLIADSDESDFPPGGNCKFAHQLCRAGHDHASHWMSDRHSAKRHWNVSLFES